MQVAVRRRCAVCVLRRPASGQSPYCEHHSRLNDLSTHLANTLQISPDAITGRARKLRDAGLLSKGKQGRYAGATMTDSDGANLLLASVVDPPYGADVAGTVARMRALPFTQLIGRDDFADTLKFMRARTFGEALEALLGDLRSDAWRFLIQGGTYPLHINCSIDTGNADVMIGLSRVRMIEGTAGWIYRDGPPHSATVFRHVYLRDDVFLNLAEALGPPP